MACDTVDVLDWVTLKADNNFDSIKGFRNNSLQLILTPFRKGRHFAKKPTDFLPIIDQLKDLHAAGFVHGDIRAYNMIFAERDESHKPRGWLIDFDFGGGTGVVSYPPGYKSTLVDGLRHGEQEHMIEEWHDWSALGKIIFRVHILIPPVNSKFQSGSLEHERLLSSLQHYPLLAAKWTNMEKMDGIKDEDIQELKDFLQMAEDCDWTVLLDDCFQADLRRERVKNVTCPKATGSPPQEL